MKQTHTVALLLLSSLYFSHGDEVARQQGGKTRGEMIAIETNSELVTSSEVQHNAASSAQCSKDGSTCLTCKSVGMCKNGVLTEVPCRGLYPYCDARTGSCTNERRRCKEDEKAMPCPGKGFYPDPQSCRAFHVCEGDPMISYKLACTPLQIYDHEEKKCARPSFRVRCTSFSCFGKQGRYTPYPSDRSIYTLCADASGTGMFKCPENQEFDETKQKCVPSCSSEDNMTDIDDETCKKYYRCVKSGMKFDAVASTCSGQRVFDPDTLKCIPKTQTFKCMHTPIGSGPPTSNQPPNKEEEESIIETHDTFFRQNPQHNEDKQDKVSKEQDKSTLVLGSANNKEKVNTGTVNTQDKDKNDKTDIKLPTTIANLATKTTQKDVSTSHGNVDAVLSMLSVQDSKGESQSSSKVVVREVASKEQSSSHPNKVEPSTSHLNGQTYPVTSEEVRTTVSTHPTPTKTLDDDTKESLLRPIAVANTENNLQQYEHNINVLSTMVPLSKQTYKVITENILKTTKSMDNQQLTTELPDKQQAIHNVQKQHHETPYTSTSKENVQEPKIPVEIKKDGNLPTQFFQIDNDKSHGMMNINHESNSNKGNSLTQHTSETSFTATSTSQAQSTNPSTATKT